jgi:hypothetical protein
MQIVIKDSFYRDWSKSGNKELSKILYKKIDEIESAGNISQISRLKNSETIHPVIK